MRYKQYWKSEFQAALSSFSRTSKMNGWKEVSEEMESEEILIQNLLCLKNTQMLIITDGNKSMK
jgi:hypothetical protein